MKAVRWHNRGDVRIEELPTPKPGDDEVLLRTTFSGICGSEVHEYVMGPVFIPLEPHPLTHSCAPQTLGHEFGGRVVEVGKNVQDLKVGDLVTVNPILACGECKACKRGRPSLCAKFAYYGIIGDGGHAEYAVVRSANCLKLPETVQPEVVAFGEPAGVAYHAVRQGEVGPGSTVVVIGGGPIGQLAVQYARQAGAARVYLSEVAPARVLCAQKLGAVDAVLNPVEVDVVEAILGVTDGEGADVVIECCGGNRTGMLADTAAQAVQLTRPGGTAVIAGTFGGPTELHFNHVVLLERRVLGSWVWHSHEEYKTALDLIVSGSVKVSPLITRKVRIDAAVGEGIRELHLSKDDHIKILVDLT